MPTHRPRSSGPIAVPLLPMQRGHPGAWQHEVPAGGSVRWVAPARRGLLLILDGLARVQFDGNALSLAAPCVLAPARGGRIEVQNMGRSPLRLLAVGRGFED